MNAIQNTSGIHPKANKLLICPVSIENVSKGGIVLPSEIVAKEEMAGMFAHVIEIGVYCWPQEPEPRCKIGDYVIYAKWAGQVFVGDDAKTYRLINSTDVLATKDYNPDDTRYDAASRKDKVVDVSEGDANA